MSMRTDEISRPIYEIFVERNVPIPMADGTILRADVYRPRTVGRYPVLVERVAYELTKRCRFHGEYYASRGYVFVGQNVRGSFLSKGRFTPFRDDAWGDRRDGYDTIKWAGEQAWSNGRVGMLDGSYSGFTQYLLTPTQPPYLEALCVREGGSDVYRDFVFHGGAYQLALHREWAIQQMLSSLQHESAPTGMESARFRLEDALENMERWYRHRPLKSCPPLEGLADWYFEELSHPEDGPYWESMNLSHKFQEVDVPILHVGGWFDCFLDSTLRCFQGIATQAETQANRESQRLLVGPWMHGPAQIGQREVGDLDFGPTAEFDLEEYRLQWYDYWLKGVENGIMDGPAVRIFLMGANRWMDLETWPPADVTYEPMYLREGTGRSAASLNNGRLTFEAPQADESGDSFIYDPEDAVPSLLVYPLLGPKDHRPVERQMLTYTSRLLEKDLTVIGPVKAVVYATSSAPDTDWVVRLSDVWPDGRSISVCDGILRARYRDSLEQQEPLSPGQTYRFEVDMSATAQVFRAGHCLRVSVTSSDFPRYDRNLNTGGSFGEEERGQLAFNTLFHDETHASHIILPVLP